MSEAKPTKTKQAKCAGTRKDGQPCTAPALSSGLCFAHDPGFKAQRAAARSQGGKNRRSIVRMRGLVPPRLLPVYDQLEAALTEVHDGNLDPKQATAMAALAKALVAVLTAGTLEERLAELERQLAERR